MAEAKEPAAGGSPLPLSGLRVVEFCHTVMGPSAGVILADLGADVIKVEAAPEGDTTRRTGDFANGLFYAFNRNKRSLAVDLKCAAGRRLIHRLAAGADVVVENFGPGTLERMGYGYADLAAINPGIVYCALKGFLGGPYEHRPALDAVAQYQAGLAYMTGPLGHPLPAGAAVIDIMGGMFGVIAIQAALSERRRTGRGQLIKAALFETAAFLVGQHMASEAASGKPPLPMSVKKIKGGAWAIYETFPTADGEKIFIGLTSDNHWRGFWEHFERPEMIEDQRYATNQLRVAERETTLPLVTEILARHSLAELIELCDRINVPFAPVARPGDLFDDPQLGAHGRMLRIQFPGGKSAPMPPLPMEVGTHRLGLRRQAPEVGQHSREILAELGLGAGEIDDLGKRGVVLWPGLVAPPHTAPESPAASPAAIKAAAPAATPSAPSPAPSPGASREEASPLPLAGIRVLEFCHTIMGPSAGVQLADLGADVIKVEAMTGSDRLRHLGGASLIWNRNKRSMAVDLKSAGGRALIHRLAEGTDVLVENYGPGTLDRLGYGYAELSAINPRIVFCALKGFLSGPYEHRPALDEVVQYMAGLAYMTGLPDAPTRVGASVIDIMGGMFGIIAVLTALAERERTGQGQLVKSSLFETTAFLMTQHMAGEVISGKPPEPMSAKYKTGSAAWAIYEPFATADGEHIFIGLTSDNHWRAFWGHFQRPDLIEDARYATNALRVANRDITRPIVAQLVKQRRLTEMVGICAAISIPFAPLGRPGDLFQDPHLLAGGRMLEIEFPQRGKANIPPLPLEMGAHRLGIRRQAPTLGQHTSEVLEELGLTAGEIEDLAAAGTVLLGD